MNLRSDTRAQSIGLSRFVLTLGVGAIMLFLIQEILTKRVLPGSIDATNNATANQGTQWLQQGVDLLPQMILLISLFGIIALAIFQREVLR